MKKFFTLVAFSLSLMVAHGQAGTIDSTFGDNGIVTTQISPIYNFGEATVIQPDGKILVAGYAGAPATYQVAVVRYNTDGSLDSTFGNNGKVTIPVGTAKSFATDIALQEDGKIVLGARTYDNVSGDIALVRLTPDGVLDNTFGTNGIVVANSGNSDVSSSLLIAEDGKIYLGGDSNETFSVTRFDADGTLDTTFGSNGWAIIPFVNNKSYLQKMVFQEDGKIVLAGFSINNEGRYQMTVARIHPDGSLDSEFATNGQLVYNIGIDQDLLTAVGIQSDGKIVVGGHTYIHNRPRLQYDFAIMRLNTDGSFDTSYGTNGVTTVKLVEEANYTNDLVIQADDKAILAGRTVLWAEYDFAMMRFTTQGELDTSFGDGGTVKTDINNREDQGHAIALQPDNKIIFVGYSYAAGGDSSDFVMVRYHNDETMDVADGQINLFSIYPNPAQDQLTIRLNDNSSHQIEIFDMLGKKIYSSTIQNVGQVDVSSFNAGTYLVKLNSNHQSSTVRFIKN